MTHSLFMHHIIKQIARRQSITDRYLHKKLDNSDNRTILWVFFTHFHFNSALSSNIHSSLANIYYGKGVAEVLPVLLILFNSSQLFFCCMTNIFRQMKKILIELMNRLQPIDSEADIGQLQQPIFSALW